MIRVTMTSELSQERNNAISAVFLGTGNIFSPVAALMFMKFARNLSRLENSKNLTILMFSRYL